MKVDIQRTIHHVTCDRCYARSPMAATAEQAVVVASLAGFDVSDTANYLCPYCQGKFDVIHALSVLNFTDNDWRVIIRRNRELRKIIRT